MNNHLCVSGDSLPAASEDTIAKVRSFEEKSRQLPQLPFVTEHVFHAGMYARTVRIPPLTVITSVLMKIPTLFIVNGRCRVLAGDEWKAIDGYKVMPGGSGRKTVCVTDLTTEITMIFPSNAKTVEEAEAEFTEETSTLLSRSMENDISITGVPSCQQSLPHS